MFNIARKTLYDKRAFIVGWSIALALLGYLMTIFYPAFHQDNALDQLVQNLPAALQGLVGNLNDLKELPSYIGSQIFAIRMPIFVSILSIILAVGLSVGEEEKGQLRTLAALPVSRTKIFLGKWSGVIVICVIVALAALIGVELGMLTIGESIAWQVLVRLGLMTGLVALSLATIILAIGLATGRRGAAMAIGVIVAAGSFILTTFASSVDWLEKYEKVSLLHYFPAVNVAKDRIDPHDVLVYFVITAVFLLLGIIFFRRRDIQ